MQMQENTNKTASLQPGKMHLCKLHICEVNPEMHSHGATHSTLYTKLEGHTKINIILMSIA